MQTKNNRDIAKAAKELKHSQRAKERERRRLERDKKSAERRNKAIKKAELPQTTLSVMEGPKTTPDNGSQPFPNQRRTNKLARRRHHRQKRPIIPEKEPEEDLEELNLEEEEPEPTAIELWHIIPEHDPDETWNDEMLEEWAKTWPEHHDPTKYDWNQLVRYHRATMARLSNGSDSWHSPLRNLGPLAVAAGISLVIYQFFIANRGYLALDWYYIPIFATLAFFVSRLAITGILKHVKHGQTYSRATISFREPDKPGTHRSKIITYMPKLAFLTRTNIHRGPIGEGGIAAGTITIPIYLGETELPNPDDPDNPRIIENEHDIVYRDLFDLEPEHKEDTWLDRGFTLRTSQIIYGALYSVTVHGEIESGTKAQLQKLLREVAGWLPAFIIWLAIMVSLFSGFSVNQTVGEYVANLPDEVRSMVNTGP